MVRVTLELPDDLAREMDRVQKLYGMSREEFMISAVKRRIDGCELLTYQAIKSEA